MYNYFMDYILAFVIFLQFVYLVYSDRENRREREDLQLKLITKTPYEYGEIKQSLSKKPVEDTKTKSEEYIDPMDLDPEVILKAKDNL